MFHEAAKEITESKVAKSYIIAFKKNENHFDFYITIQHHTMRVIILLFGS